MHRINSRLVKIQAIMSAGGKEGSTHVVTQLTNELKDLSRKQLKVKREAEDPVIKAQRERLEMLKGRSWADLSFGLAKRRKVSRPPVSIKRHSSGTTQGRKGNEARHGSPFVFVSTFKWEMRKGWDVLLQAYLEEFSSEDDVELYILTKPFAESGSNFKDLMQKRMSSSGTLNAKPQELFPSLYVISQHMTAEEYSGLYKSSNIYVIPTRGEGWGMPIAEAMSMGLAVIVTNWSGTVDFVDDQVGYLISTNLSLVPRDKDIPWWFKGARWADCSVQHLREIMRHVYSNREEARKKGISARKLMQERYSPGVVGKIIAGEVERIKAMVNNSNCTDCVFNDKYVVPPGGNIVPDFYTGSEEFPVIHEHFRPKRGFWDGFSLMATLQVPFIICVAVGVFAALIAAFESNSNST